MADDSIDKKRIAEVLGISDSIERTSVVNPDDALSIIADTVARAPKVMYECRVCEKSFYITHAKDGEAYSCAKCKSRLFKVDRGDITSINRDRIDLIIDETVPPEVQEALRNRENVIGKYVLLRKIAEGGGGAIYLSFEVGLSRYVAIKFIKSNQVDELKAEARALAALEHRNIGRIYEIGNYGGKGYIAMQFVDGYTLDKIELTENRALRVILAVCEAIHYAHTHGIIHRDIKPTNIMIDRDNNVYVMDFGVAARTTTDDREVVGTPGFMAPEIALFKPATTRSDVYSTGATMYFILSRRVPIPVTSEESWHDRLKKVKLGNFVPLREVKADISTEIEAIVKKALSVSADQRYESTRELADDVRRYLNGYPVSAFGSSITYRMKKAVKRNRVIVSVIAACVVILAAAGVFLLTNVQKTQQAEKERNALVAGFLEDMSREHQTALEERREGKTLEQLRRIAERVERKYKIIRDTGIKDARVEYSLGRLYRMIGDDARAKSQQESALAIDANHIDAHYELGIITYREYAGLMEILREQWRRAESGRRFAAGSQGEWKDADDEKIENARARDLKALALEHFSKAGSDPIVSAIVAHISKRSADVEAFLAKVLKGDESNEDAVFFFTLLMRAKGTPQPAFDALDRAIAIDRGNVMLHMIRAQMKNGIGLTMYMRGQDPTTDFRESISSLESALHLHPGRRDALLRVGSAKTNWGIYEQYRGGDPLELYRGAADAYNAVLKSEKDDYDAHSYRGGVYMNIAMFLTKTGRDAAAENTMALADFDAAIRVDPKRYEAWLWKGMIHVNIAFSDVAAGNSSLKNFELAVNSLNESIKLNGAHAESFMRRGIAHMNWGLELKTRGKDPMAEYSKALEDLDASLKLNPTDFETLLTRGNTFLNVGSYKVQTGVDPISDFRKAIDDLGVSAKLNTQHHETWLSIGTAYLNWGSYLAQMEQDPATYYAEAIKVYSDALKLNEKEYRGWLWRGNAYMNRGAYKHSHKGDPTGDYQNAISDFDAAIKVNDKSYECWTARANCNGAWMIAVLRGTSKPDALSADDLYVELQKDYDKVFELNPNDGESYFRRGLFHYYARNFALAAKDFEKGAGFNKSLVPMFKEFWDDAKKRVKQEDY